MTHKTILTKSAAMLSVGVAILNESSHINGKHDNSKRAEMALYLANTLEIPPAEVPLVLDTVDKQIVELDKQVDIYSATDADHMRAIRRSVYANAMRSAEADRFARALFAKMGMNFDSDQFDLIGADDTMTGVSDRTRTEEINPAFAHGADLQTTGAPAHTMNGAADHVGRDAAVA